MVQGMGSVHSNASTSISIPAYRKKNVFRFDLKILIIVRKIDFV